MRTIEFDRKVYLRGASFGAGDFAPGDRRSLPDDLAAGCVRAGDAHYVDADEPVVVIAPSASSAASHPFVAAANILNKQSTSSITEELQIVNGIVPDPVEETPAPIQEDTPDAPTDPVDGIEPENASGEGSDDPPAPLADPEPKARTCDVCNDGREFATTAALASHRRAKHGLTPTVNP